MGVSSNLAQQLQIVFYAQQLKYNNKTVFNATLAITYLEARCVVIVVKYQNASHVMHKTILLKLP